MSFFYLLSITASALLAVNVSRYNKDHGTLPLTHAHTHSKPEMFTVGTKIPHNKTTFKTSWFKLAV